MPHFNVQTTLPAPREAAFRWHARPAAFRRLLPPWVSARIQRVYDEVQDGAELEFVVRRAGISLRWLARHRNMVADREFTDVQIAGPFRSWVHRHCFEDSPGGCLLTDTIDYELPAFAGPAAAWIRADLERMFRFRSVRTARDLRRLQAAPSPGNLPIAVSGASGLVGSALSEFLSAGGHMVLPIVRRRLIPNERAISWIADVDAEKSDAEKGGGFSNCGAVVHLAGAPIVDRRWTPARKKILYDSRVESTRRLVAALGRSRQRPEVLICASAVGYYADCGDEWQDEASPRGSGFLAPLCEDWEQAAMEAEKLGIRVVCARLGIVIAKGGAVAKMMLPFLMGVGGPIGSGRQWQSWVALDDVVGILHRALWDSRLSGPVNVVAPNPVTSAEFARVLGRVLHRPSAAPLPAPVVRLMFGELANETLLQGARVRPAVLDRLGFEFQEPGLEGALRSELGK